MRELNSATGKEMENSNNDKYRRDNRRKTNNTM